MATTRLFALHIGKGRSVSRAISDIIDYVENPEKTDYGRLITSFGCDSRVADEQFLLAKREYHYITGRDQGKRDVLAYHIRQSFKPGEVSPEEANEIGRQLALSFTKGKHAFVVCTHIDKQHVHNHIIFNSTTLDCERKFDDPYYSGKIIRRISDLLCAEHGLSVIENPKPSRGNYGTWLDEKADPSFQQILRRDIDAALAKKPPDFEAFLTLMQTSGYKVKRGKHIKLTGPGQLRGTRLDTLRGDYTEQAIRERIEGKLTVTSSGGSAPEPVPVTHFKLLVDIQAKLQEGKGVGFACWARSFNLKEAAKTLIFLQDQGIESYDDLLQKTSGASAGFNRRVTKIRAAEKRMDEIKELQKAISNYIRTREVYKRYKAAGYSAKFKAAHENDILTHQSTKKYFDSLGIKKLPKIDELKQEFASLAAERKQQYVGYNDAKENMRQLIMARGNVQQILGLDSAAPNAEKRAEKPTRAGFGI